MGSSHAQPIARRQGKRSSLEVGRHPVPAPTVERLAVELNVGIVPSLLALEEALPTELHPGHRQDGPGVRAGEGHGVLLAVV